MNTTVDHQLTCPVHTTTALDHYHDGIWWCHTCQLEYVVSVSRAYPTTTCGIVNPDAPFHQLVLDIDAIWRQPHTGGRFARKVA